MDTDRLSPFQVRVGTVLLSMALTGVGGVPSVSGQAFDKVHRPTYLSEYRAGQALPNGTWAVAGWEWTDTSSSRRAVVRLLDPLGVVTDEFLPDLGASYAMEVSCMGLLPLDTLILGMKAGGPCGDDPFGLIVAYHEGMELWRSDSLDSEPRSVAVGEEQVIVTFLDHFLRFDHDGVLLEDTSWAGTYDLRATSRPGGHVLYGVNGLRVLDSVGLPVDSLTGIQVRGVAPSPLSGFMILTSDSLVHLNEQLERSGLGVPVAGISNKLAYSDSLLAVFGGGPVQLFTPELNWSSTTSLPPEMSYSPKGAAISGTKVLTHGAQDFGAAVWSWPAFSGPEPPAGDITLLDLEIDSTAYAIDWDQPFSFLVEGNYWCTLTVQNSGTSQLDSMLVLSTPDSSPCEGENWQTSLNGPGWGQGLSDTIHLGPIPFLRSFNFPPFVTSLCLSVHAPNGGMDAQVGDNELCRSIEILTDVTELSRGSKISVHPNPFQDELFLTSLTPLTSPASLQLTDVQGRTLLQVPDVGGRDRVRIRPEGLRPGLYLLQLRTPEGTRTLRVVRSTAP